MDCMSADDLKKLNKDKKKVKKLAKKYDAFLSSLCACKHLCRCCSHHRLHLDQRSILSLVHREQGHLTLPSSSPLVIKVCLFRWTGWMASRMSQCFRIDSSLPRFCLRLR